MDFSSYLFLVSCFNIFKIERKKSIYIQINLEERKLGESFDNPNTWVFYRQLHSHMSGIKLVVL